LPCIKKLAKSKRGAFFLRELLRSSRGSCEYLLGELLRRLDGGNRRGGEEMGEERRGEDDGVREGWIKNIR
jgi:hypothetical protein